MRKVNYSPEDPRPIEDLVIQKNYYKHDLQFTLEQEWVNTSSEIIDIHARGL